MRPSVRAVSIRLRLTALFVAIFGATLIGFAAMFYDTFSVTAQSEFDAALFNYASDISDSIDVNLFGEIMIQKDPQRSGRRLFPFSVRNALVQIASTDGRVIVHSDALQKFTLPLMAGDLSFLSSHGTEVQTLPATMVLGKGAVRSHYRILNLMVRDRGPFAFILQVAVPTGSIEEQRHRILIFLLLSIPITLLVATFGGLFLSGRALKPVSTIIDKLRKMSPADLKERLPEPSANDELRQLTLTLNELLSRLQQAFVSQERFVSDASHELKTPLSILRGELDLIRGRERPAEEIREFLSSASQELDYLSRIVEDLLLLARVDAGMEALAPTRARLDELVLEAIERLDPAAKRKSIRIRLDFEGGEFETRGDADLLRSLFKNLIENAIKFSPEGSLVEVRLAEVEAGLRPATRAIENRFRLTVRDQGPGIAPELAQRVFERFYRGPAAQGNVPGTGLGLAIAKRIAEVHHAQLSLDSRPGEGATFAFEIDRA